MAEMQSAGAYEYVTLVDRSMKGGCEFIYDGVRVVFKPGEMEKPVPQFLAAWLFQTDKEKVHTTDGRFVNRFGMKNPTDEMLEQLGPDVANCDPIEIDHQRIERWDVEGYVPNRKPVHTVTVSPRPEDYAGVAAPSGTFGNER
jgi:hypothetical protein